MLKNTQTHKFFKKFDFKLLKKKLWPYKLSTSKLLNFSIKVYFIINQKFFQKFLCACVNIFLFYYLRLKYLNVNNKWLTFIEESINKFYNPFLYIPWNNPRFKNDKNKKDKNKKDKDKKDKDKRDKDKNKNKKNKNKKNKNKKNKNKKFAVTRKILLSDDDIVKKNNFIGENYFDLKSKKDQNFVFLTLKQNLKRHNFIFNKINFFILSYFQEYFNIFSVFFFWFLFFCKNIIFSFLKLSFFLWFNFISIFYINHTNFFKNFENLYSLNLKFKFEVYGVVYSSFFFDSLDSLSAFTLSNFNLLSFFFKFKLKSKLFLHDIVSFVSVANCFNFFIFSSFAEKYRFWFHKLTLEDRLFFNRRDQRWEISGQLWRWVSFPPRRWYPEKCVYLGF